MSNFLIILLSIASVTYHFSSFFVRQLINCIIFFSRVVNFDLFWVNFFQNYFNGLCFFEYLVIFSFDFLVTVFQSTSWSSLIGFFFGNENRRFLA